MKIVQDIMGLESMVRKDGLEAEVIAPAATDDRSGISEVGQRVMAYWVGVVFKQEGGRRA